jgi:transposase, IS5 family
MRPKREPEQPQRELLQMDLEQLIDMSHPLVRLGVSIDWQSFEQTLGSTYHPSQGAPGISTRLMLALHYLKYQQDLSDEDVVAVWVENPYWQHFSGMRYFQHRMPIDPSSMTRWRKRLGDAGAEQMLRATIEAGIAMRVIGPAELKRINVDTTVETKAIRFPTDARLYERMRERLVKAARAEGLAIKQSYQHVGRRLLMQSSRYAHARQMKRARACTRKLKTQLGRVMREIERQTAEPSVKLNKLLRTAHRIHAQQKHDKNKVYSVHEPEVECIAKGKAGKRYEFGNKVSVAVSSRGGWFVGAKSFTGNPYDGHTLAAQMKQVENIIGAKVSEAYVDMGYRGHDYDGPVAVHVDKRRRGRTSEARWRWMKRRAAVEPSIGHLKSEHRLERNRLKGTAGNAINAILAAAAMNLQKLLGAFWRIFLLCLTNVWNELLTLRGPQASDPQLQHA